MFSVCVCVCVCRKVKTQRNRVPKAINEALVRLVSSIYHQACIIHPISRHSPVDLNSQETTEISCEEDDKMLPFSPVFLSPAQKNFLDLSLYDIKVCTVLAFFSALLIYSALLDRFADHLTLQLTNLQQPCTWLFSSLFLCDKQKRRASAS